MQNSSFLLTLCRRSREGCRAQPAPKSVILNTKRHHFEYKTSSFWIQTSSFWIQNVVILNTNVIILNTERHHFECKISRTCAICVCILILQKYPRCTSISARSNLQNSSFLIHNPSFLIQNFSFSTQNSSFLSHVRLAKSSVKKMNAPRNDLISPRFLWLFNGKPRKSGVNSTFFSCFLLKLRRLWINYHTPTPPWSEFVQ